MPGPPFIGLTGGIGAGKSEAVKALSRLGAATLSTDAVAHSLLDEAGVRARLIERWGTDILDGEYLDRDRIAAIVFKEPDELKWLESVLHPLVRERVAVWRESLDGGELIGVVEVPLLHEGGMDPIFDATLCVTADSATRRERAQARGLSSIEGRADRQLSQEAKAARSTYVVSNDGTLEELEAKLRALLPALRAITG